MKRILAIGTIVILILLYVVTLVFAFVDRSQASSWFNASLFCTIVLPVILWIYMHCYELVKKQRDDEEDK
jgi:uncharacterized membrane protein